MFNSVAVAGTFDHLHLGHQKLLAAAQHSGRTVLVGLCQKSMLKTKTYSRLIEAYHLRQKTVKNFFADKPSKIFPLSDIYGPAATSQQLQAIVCTQQTQANVTKINYLRQQRRLKPLTAIQVNLVKSTDQGSLSSTRIRAGEINRRGFAYQQIFPNPALVLPQHNRRYFQKPFSRIISQIQPPQFLSIAVGDIATLSLLEKNIRPSLAVVDLKTKRQQIFSRLEELGLKPGLTATNPAGTITQDLVKKLLTCLHQGQATLLVRGEEDLAVLPAILLAPLKTTIFYGQPEKGLVRITVTEKSKEKARKLLEKFI